MTRRFSEEWLSLLSYRIPEPVKQKQRFAIEKLIFIFLQYLDPAKTFGFESTTLPWA
jgi:hypothetical protein